MSLWLELVLVFGGLVALIAVVWVPLLAMDYRLRKSACPGWGLCESR